MADISVKPVKKLNARAISGDKILLAFETADGASAFSVQPNQLNELIRNLLVVSYNERLLENRPAPVAEGYRVEKVLTLPIERISASHAPAKGTVGISIILPTGFHVAFDMKPHVSMALSQQLQAAAGKVQVPKSTATH